MSQADLVLALKAAGSEWTRSGVAMLENEGTGGDRLSSVLALCAAFQIPLSDLLEDPAADRSEGYVHIRGAGAKSLHWLTETLVNGRAEPSVDGEQIAPPGPHIGVVDRDADRRIAEQAGLTPRQLDEYLSRMYEMFDSLEPDTPTSVSVYRDFIAQVTAEMDARTIAARRGHATRQISEALREDPENRVEKLASYFRRVLDQEEST